MSCRKDSEQDSILAQHSEQHSDPVFSVYFHYLPMISGILTPFPQNNKPHFIDKIVIDVKTLYAKV